MRTRTTATLVAFLLLIACNQLAFSQTPVSSQDAKRIEKVKKDVEKIKVGNTITVSRLDNRDFFGRVKSIGNDDFEIIETDSKQVLSFKYVDIKNVREGDGNNRYVGGQRKNPRSKWFVFGGAIAALFVIVVVAGSQTK